MAKKRKQGVSPKRKVSSPHKTQKRLVAKKAMLAKKKSRS